MFFVPFHVLLSHSLAFHLSHFEVATLNQSRSCSAFAWEEVISKQGKSCFYDVSVEVEIEMESRYLSARDDKEVGSVKENLVSLEACVLLEEGTLSSCFGDRFHIFVAVEWGIDYVCVLAWEHGHYDVRVVLANEMNKKVKMGV
ncbi:hypothetical protein MMC14_004205 [Varicellaria rhodocarpa]|nr:hypothetical protein [Varicellaria rhodocarpa]